MALIRWQPRESFALQNEINNMVNNFWGDMEGRDAGGWYPKVDVAESEHGFTVQAELPGLKKEDIKVTFEDHVLTVEGERKQVEEQKDQNFFRRERAYGKFRRSFKLATEVDADKVGASYQDGILTLTLPKSEAVKPRQIDISVA